MTNSTIVPLESTPPNTPLYNVSAEYYIVGDNAGVFVTLEQSGEKILYKQKGGDQTTNFVKEKRVYPPPTKSCVLCGTDDGQNGAKWYGIQTFSDSYEENSSEHPNSNDPNRELQNEHVHICSPCYEDLLEYIEVVLRNNSELIVSHSI